MKNLLFFFTLILSSFTVSAQANYYVSTTGDNNADGSLSTPWETLQYACNQLGAGDILNIMGGTYVGKIDLNNSGSASQVITIQNHQNEIVNINGVGLANYEYLLSIENVSYISISGIHFRDYQKLDAIGIQIINSSYISILDNEFSNIDYSATAVGQTPNSSQNSQPIIVFGRDPLNPNTDIQINNNTIYDCEVGWSECLSINGNIDGFEVMNNHIYDNTNIALVAIGHEGECSDPQFDQARSGLIKDNLIHDNPSAYASAGGIYIDGGKDITVENNTSYNNDYGIEVGCENNGNAPNDPSSSNILVRNNIVYNNSIAGIILGGYNYPSSGKVTTTTITNNTCFNNDTSNSYTGEISVSYIENCSIENNIFYTTNTEKVLSTMTEPTPTLTFDYNVFYSPSGANDMTIELNGTGYYEFSTYQNSTGQNTNSVFADPAFISNSLPNPDLHISANSPAKEAGNPVLTAMGALDMDGEARISGDVDCGADEYYATTGVHIYTTPACISIFPNPFTDKVVIDGDFSNYNIQVLDALGQLVTDYSSVSSPLEIDLNSLGAGLYFISVQESSNSLLSVYKILKE